MNLLFCFLAVLPLLGLLLTQLPLGEKARNRVVITAELLMLAAGGLLCAEMLWFQAGPAISFSPRTARNVSHAITAADVLLLFYVI